MNNSLRMETQNMARLRQKQEQALLETEKQLTHWKKFQSDYVALRERLKTLSDKICHDVMVPCGSLAFMPGQIVHTNEILVLLGDNYFVERSAQQAGDIVMRRLAGLEKMIESLQKQKQLLIPRADFTSELLDLLEGVGDAKEIREEFDEENEKLWRERHRQYLQKARLVKKSEGAAGEEDEERIEGDRNLWKRLDELECQENERQELESLTSDSGKMPSQKESKDTIAGSHVHFNDGSTQISDTQRELSGDIADKSVAVSSDEEEETSDSESDDLIPQKKVIKFSHTNSDPKALERAPCVEEVSTVKSPADIYQLIHLNRPKSILKSCCESDARFMNLQTNPQPYHSDSITKQTATSPLDRQVKSVSFVSEHQGTGKESYNFPGGDADLATETMKACKIGSGQGDSSSQEPDQDSKHSSLADRKKAFTGTVIDKSTDINATSIGALSKETSGVNSCDQRPVSKFRAARQKQVAADH